MHPADRKPGSGISYTNRQGDAMDNYGPSPLAACYRAYRMRRLLLGEVEPDDVIIIVHPPDSEPARDDMTETWAEIIGEALESDSEGVNDS